jgi:hypothetical protein
MHIHLFILYTVHLFSFLLPGKLGTSFHFISFLPSFLSSWCCHPTGYTVQQITLVKNPEPKAPSPAQTPLMPPALFQREHLPSWFLCSQWQDCGKHLYSIILTNTYNSHCATTPLHHLQPNNNPLLGILFPQPSIMCRCFI